MSIIPSQARCKQATLTPDTDQDVPPKLESIRHEVIVDSDESDRRLEWLHENVRRFGTVCHTVAPGADLAGTLRRKVLLPS
jgi:hypothetical protein